AGIGAELSLLFGQGARIVLYQTPVVVLAVTLAWFLMPASWHEFRGPVALTMTTFVVTFPLRLFCAVLPVRQDFNFIGRAQIITWFIATTVTIVLVLKGLAIYSLAIGWALSQMLLALIAAFRVWHAFPEVIPRRLPALPWSALHNFLGRGFWIS